MGLIHSIKLTNFINDELLRIDTKFHILNSKIGWNIFEVKDRKLIPLKNILKPYYENFYYQDDEEYKGIPTGREYLNEFGDIKGFQIVTREEHPNRLKYKVNDKCILISSLKGARTPALTFDFDLSEYVFSNGFYIFQVDENWNKKFVLYLLRTDILKNVLDNHIYRGIGISSYQESDFLKIQIPNISLNAQNEIVKKIEPIEQEIHNLKSQKKEHLEIINEVFADELNFDWQEFNRLKDEKIFSSSLIRFSNNKDLRCSYKFHNLEYQFLHNFLTHKTSKKIKDFISEPIVLGKGISTSLYDDDGDYYYIAMSNIKNYTFETEDCKKIGIEFYKQNINKSIKVNDILFARSGEGTIGKVAIIEDDEIEGIFADFTMRIRLKNYNPTFAYYYFRSDFFQYLVYTHKKGLGNNTNIFPSQVQEFPILNFTLEKQQQIVEEIKSQINAQKLIDQKIEQKQKEISDLIYHCVQSS